MKIIQGFKGFDKNLKCRDYQYEVGKEFEEKERIKVCDNGFHLCEDPADVFSYYPPADSEGNLNRFCEVEGAGEIDNDLRHAIIACSKINISAEIGIKGLSNAWVKFILDKVNWDDSKKANTGYQSAATNIGNQSAATNTGDRSAASNTGYQSAATNTGYRSAATNIGYRSAATNTGAQSAASNTGDWSTATNTGDQSAATNTGYCSVATNTGEQSAATNTGDQSAATNTGEQSAASNTGDRSAATNTGNQSVAINTGNQSAATNTGIHSSATVEGKDSIAIVTGYDSKAKAPLGCWIVLTERGEWDGITYPILSIQAFKVDGKSIKENTFYKLVDGKPEEVE